MAKKIRIVLDVDPEVHRMWRAIAGVKGFTNAEVASWMAKVIYPKVITSEAGPKKADAA
jgi:hypothetical protein